MEKTFVKDHFDANAETWLAENYDGDAYVYSTPRHRIRVVLERLADADDALDIADIGCGGGDLALALAARGHRVTGLDQAPGMIEIAEARRRDLAEASQVQIKFTLGDLEANDLPDSAFDAVTSMGVIGYLDNDAPFFQAADRLLKPGGRLVVSSRNRLFNMNSLSFRTLNEIDAGAAPDLIAEMSEYCQPVPDDVAEALVARLQTLPSTLAGLEAAHQKQSAGSLVETTEPEIEARQHTPRERNASAAARGFKCRSVHGIHPHLLDPRLNRLLPPGLFNALAAPLEALENQPVSLLWSSVFIAVYEKMIPTRVKRST